MVWGVFCKQLHKQISHIKKGDVYNITLQLQSVALSVSLLICLSWMDTDPDCHLALPADAPLSTRAAPIAVLALLRYCWTVPWPARSPLRPGLQPPSAPACLPEWNSPTPAAPWPLRMIPEGEVQGRRLTSDALIHHTKALISLQ